ncbi:hypothetical protein C7377_0303 [Balneicella halophila]|uniref:Uncharacterized protein n=1 Tax=Balneicella halophila TaxID=1537566 RepID=A0A7L4UQE9_BALHA|nr:hypothetical protein [Balneicella halophila]PVX52008.1 hypothetical protein C7377_0303 [Balneicella halophila]
MKTSTIIYIVSLIILIGAIALSIEYPDSGRLQLISGMLIPVGFILNVIGFLTKKRK